MTADEVRKALGMERHPREGGWFAETYRSGVLLPASAYANSAERLRYDGPRRIGSAIYYLLELGEFSEMHRLASDEVFHHYAGAPVRMLQLGPGGRIEQVVLGTDLAAGHRPQVIVPRGVWQGSRIVPGSEPWALLGCTVSPGFEYADYETGTREELVRGYPEVWEEIYALTRRGG